MNLTNSLEKKPTLLPGDLPTWSVANATMIGGCGRSGTSILGHLIGSFKDTAYFYDPPLFHKLIYQIREMPEESFKTILETDLFNALLNRLAGRTLNFNSHDLTYIGNYLDQQTIDQRLAKSHSRTALLKQVPNHTICIKCTDLIFAFAELKKYYPTIKGIFIIRDFQEAVNSLVKKEWFTKENLHPAAPLPLIDFKVTEDLRYPRWVLAADYEFWQQANVYERSAYYYVRANETLLAEDFPAAHLLSYQQLLEAPRAVAKKIATYVNRVDGPKTTGVIEHIQPQAKERMDILPFIREESLKNRLLAINEKMTMFNHNL